MSSKKYIFKIMEKWLLITNVTIYKIKMINLKFIRFDKIWNKKYNWSDNILCYCSTYYGRKRD